MYSLIIILLMSLLVPLVVYGLWRVNKHNQQVRQANLEIIQTRIVMKERDSNWVGDAKVEDAWEYRGQRVTADKSGAPHSFYFLMGVDDGLIYDFISHTGQVERPAGESRQVFPVRFDGKSVYVVISYPVLSEVKMQRMTDVDTTRVLCFLESGPTTGIEDENAVGKVWLKAGLRDYDQIAAAVGYVWATASWQHRGVVTINGCERRVRVNSDCHPMKIEVEDL